MRATSIHCMAAGRLFAAACAVLILSVSCAGRKAATECPPAPVVTAPSPTVSAAPEPAARIYRETGLASWYGRESHGRKTTSGAMFDMFGMTAAHRTLPLGTRVRVTNLDTYQSVVVTVNDRGPFVKTRVIELSYGAAKELGFVEQGTATVKIESLEPIVTGGLYTVQAAIFTEEESAKNLKDRLSKKFEQVSIVPFETGLGKLFRVRVGTYGTEEKAELVASRLKLEGMEPFVIRKD